MITIKTIYERLLQIETNDRYTMWFLNFIFPKVSDLYQRSIVHTTNLVSFCIGVILIVATIYSTLAGEFINACIVFSTALFLLSNLFIGSKHSILFTKLLSIHCPWMIVLANLLLQDRIPAGQVFSVIGATIMSSFFIGILIDRKTESRLYYASALILLSFSISFDWLVLNWSQQLESIKFIHTYEIYSFFKFPHILVMLTIIITASFFKDLLNKYKRENELLINTVQLNNEELNALNNYLEEKVAQRTLALQSSREKIAEVAFLSSHKLRGPIATILGLTDLISIDPTNQEVLQFLPKLREVAQNADQAIFEMTDNLKEELYES